METLPETIRTTRLLLRPWRRSDLPFFAQMNQDPRVMEFLPSVADRRESDAMAQRLRDHFDRHGFGRWVIEAPGVAEFIGMAGLARAEFPAGFTPCVEIGWRLASAYWGKGYATESAAAAIGFGFEHLGLEEIDSFTVPANARSRAVMHRLGMRHDAEGDFEHPALPAGHPLRLHVLYRLTRDQWQGDTRPRSQ